MNTSRCIFLSLLLCGASTSLAEEATGIVFKKPLADPVTEELQACVSSREVRNIEILSDKLLILKGTHNRYWINQLPRSCVGLDESMILRIESFGNRMCSNDRFEAAEPFDGGSFVAECRWGMFEPAALEQVAMIKSELKKS